MENAVQFTYDDFWKLYEANDRPEPQRLEQDGWTDSVELEEPAPPWVRVVSRRDPFPPCAALAFWPKNCSAGVLADLSPEEEAEEDPDRFVFSDGEMEAWVDCVHLVADEVVGPRLPLGTSFKHVVKEAPANGLSEVMEMADRQKTGQAKSEGEGSEPKAPPVHKISAGGVRLAIWANDGPKGGTFHSVTIERTFRRSDATGKDAWGSTRALRVNDIPKAVTVLQKAYEWLLLRGEDVVEDDSASRVPPTAAHDLNEVVSRAVAAALAGTRAGPNDPAVSG